MSIALETHSAPPKIDVARVFAQSFGVTWKRLPALAILAFAFIFAPQALTGFLPPDLERLGVVANLPSLLFDGAAAMITYRQISSSNPVGIVEALRASARRFGSLWGMGIISGLGIILGLLLLIVPGVFLIVAWMPATAAIVNEDIGATQGLDRAWKLTRGCRWALAGLLGLVLAVFLGLALMVFLSTILVTVLTSENVATQFAAFLLTPLVVSLVQVVAVVIGAAAYTALRAAKEGGADVAAVFE